MATGPYADCFARAPGLREAAAVTPRIDCRAETPDDSGDARERGFMHPASPYVRLVFVDVFKFLDPAENLYRYGESARDGIGRNALSVLPLRLPPEGSPIATGQLLESLPYWERPFNPPVHTLVALAGCNLVRGMRYRIKLAGTHGLEKTCTASGLRDFAIVGKISFDAGGVITGVTDGIIVPPMPYESSGDAEAAVRVPDHAERHSLGRVFGTGIEPTCYSCSRDPRGSYAA